jgi:hypothetical protein
MLPDFLIIGAQRCATGWMSQCLREHPDVFMARDETRFFDRHYEKGLAWWERTYFRGHPEVPRRIAASLPQVKLICCLRDPVERMYSGYVLRARQGGRSDAFLRAVTLHSDLVQRGLYYQQLKRFLEYFRRDSLLVKLYDEKLRDPVGFIQDVYRFLEVDSTFVPPSVHRQTKPGLFENTHRVFFAISRVLLHRYSPFKTLYSRMRAKLHSPWAVGFDEGPLLELRRLFSADIEALETLLGRDLSHWKAGAWETF